MSSRPSLERTKSNVSSIVNWKKYERIIFRLSISASNTFLDLCYEDKDHESLMLSSHFQNFELGVDVGTVDFTVTSSLGTCHLQR